MRVSGLMPLDPKAEALDFLTSLQHFVLLRFVSDFIE